MDTLVVLTDRDLRPISDPIPWTAVDAVARFNEPGTASVTHPAHQWITELLAEPARAVLIDQGRVFMAGPIERPFGYQREAGGGLAAAPGQNTFTFTDDLALVAGRRTYPNPAQPATGQTTARWSRNAAAGTVMTSLVDLNAGPGALPDRRVPGLVIGAGAGIGSGVTFSTRFQPLGDELRALAILGGGLGFRTTEADAQIVFEVYQTTDRARSVRFSWGLGNLQTVQFDSEAPKVTTALVGGQDEGAARTIIEATNTDAEQRWWRIEEFVDRRDTDDTTELEQAGDKTLTEGAETARLSTVTVETPTQRYGVHYQLGDVVAVEPIPGIEVVDVVRAAHLQLTARRRLLTTMVGSQAASSTSEWLDQSRRLAAQLGRLETI